jgi:hypothetical protein
MIEALMFGIITLVFYVIYEAMYAEDIENKNKKEDEDQLNL